MRCSNGRMGALAVQSLSARLLLRLVAALRRTPNMSVHSSTAPTLTSAAAPASSPASASDLPAADQPSELPVLPGVDATLAVRRLGGNLVLYRQILRIFAHSHAHAVSDIAQALATGQPDAAVRLSHTMQGAVATLGAPALAQSFFDLEAAIEAGEAARASGLLAGLGVAVGALVGAIEATLPR